MALIKSVALAALLGHVVLVSAYPPQQQDYRHGHYDDGDDHSVTGPYHFEYGVKDPHTHDIKSQSESSDGHGNVKGSYSLLEADGSTRVVEYTAGDEGFNAVVKKIESPHHVDNDHHYQHDKHQIHQFHHDEHQLHHDEHQLHHDEPQFHHDEPQLNQQQADHHYQHDDGQQFHHDDQQQLHHADQLYQHGGQNEYYYSQTEAPSSPQYYKYY